MRKLFIICLFATAPGFLRAQTVSGSWFGRADVDLTGIHNNYLTELVIKQKGTRVEGIFGYYFRDKYQSYFIHGRFNPKTREIIILNLPVIYFNSNSTVNSIDCITNFRGILINSKVSSSLSGTFYHDEKFKYMCPDLKVSYTLDRNDKEQDSMITEAARARIWKPQADDLVVEEVKAPSLTVTPATEPGTLDSTRPVPDSTMTVKDSTGMAVPGSGRKPDSVRTAETVTRPGSITAAAPPPSVPDRIQDSLKITELFGKRKAVLNRELLVESDSVRLSFYDNGEIDGDSISVFINNELVLSHQGLEAKAFNIYLHLDSTRELNEISMFAENLGSIPPNTALMIVTDGKNRYEVFLSSSLTENATVELRRKKKE
jgi:hypothetical protein